MTLPTKAVLYAATYPRDPKPGAPCNISIGEFDDWLTETIRQSKEQALNEAARELDRLAIDFTINRQNYAAANDDPQTVIALASVTVRNLKDNQ